MRWGLRLGDDALRSISVQCVVRDGDGRWLAGRRAAWVATWAGRWALGAGGAVEVGENPVETLTRELDEEWGLIPERTQIEALVCTPNRLVLLVGSVWVASGAEVVRDPEHDAHAWWPADPDEWPDEAVAGAARAWPSCSPARLRDLSYVHSVVYLALLYVAFVDRARRPGDRLRMGARPRLDRDVAAVPGGGPAPADPALARRDGGRCGRYRPVRRLRGFLPWTTRGSDSVGLDSSQWPSKRPSPS